MNNCLHDQLEHCRAKIMKQAHGLTAISIQMLRKGRISAHATRAVEQGGLAPLSPAADAAPPGHLNAGRCVVPPFPVMRTGSQGSWERCFLRLGNTPYSEACLETQSHMQHSAVASLQLRAAMQLASPAAGAGPGPQTEVGDGAWEHESSPDSIWLDRSGYSSWRSDPWHTNPAWTI